MKQWPDTLTWAERWIATGHIPEPAYRALMVAHAGLGDQASVTAVLSALCRSPAPRIRGRAIGRNT